MSGLMQILKNPFSSATSGQYKLDVRVQHSTQVIGDNLYLWGGNNVPFVHNNYEKRRLTSQIAIFNITSGIWNSRPTNGSPPLGVKGYLCTSSNDKIYYFGGWCHHHYCFHNSLNELNISTLTWTQLQSTNDSITLMKRGYGGIMSSEQAGKPYLLIIGGFGSPPSIQLPQAQYYQLPSGNVRTNEQNIYDLTTGQWIIPEIIGQYMPPTSYFVMEAVNNTRAIIFGGRVEDTASNTLYILDIINHTVHWQTIAKPDLVVQWPEETWSHAASIITGSISPILVMTGGMDKASRTIKDCWILDINEKLWTKINLPDSVTERNGHSLSTFIMGPHSVWLMVVGGKLQYNGANVRDPNKTMLIELVLNDGQWSVGFVLDSNDLTSSYNYQQRVLRQLIEGRRECCIEQRQKRNVKQEDNELHSIIQSLQDELRETRDHYHQQLQQTQQAQQQLQDCQQQLKQAQDEIQQTKDQYQQQLQQKQQWIQELEHQLQQSQDEIQETRQARDQYQQSNVSLLQRLQQTEQAQQDIEQQLEQLHSQQEQPHWVVGREEVSMTQEVLGKGAYGKVRVAVFRGLRVAAKSLHGIIISDYNQDVFYREMDIASRVRHPNLVQFIGATRVGTPIILTEIMATSLYKELQKKALTQSQILGISCDVASALNYLHLWKPDPIIHRDISSSNVLLEPSVGDRFKAKIADYGAANLQQRAKTFMPGNPAYASPESQSRDPKSQTPAMDVYSYSVLLMEMTLHRLPAMTVSEREQQASRIQWPPMSSLIQRCLKPNHHDRLTMIEILEELKQMKI